MQYVNDDMDELFKRAAENYPLDTNSANWNKVLAALQGETGAKTVPEKKGNKNGRLLWLLLLLPLGLICNQLYSPGNVNSKGAAKATVQEETLSPVIKIDQQKSSKTDNKASNSDNINSTVTTNSGETNTNRNKIDESMSSSGVSSTGLHKTSSSFYTGAAKNHLKAYSSADIFTDGNSKERENADDLVNEAALYQRSYVSKVSFSKKLGDLPPNMFNRKFDPLVNSPKENSKKPVHVARRKKFYGGVMGGVDVTTIKFQKVDNAGKTFGILLGYQLNKKWSIESGVYLERKYYYTEGKYFDASKFYRNMPSNYWIDNVDGNCKMIEIPVALKYNFASHKNSEWFGTVGTSSYFMQKESYSYDYYYGSVSSYGRHEKDFTDTSKNIFSNISVSAGYTHRLGNFADLRIEPYLKLPVSKMGVANLPFVSTGLQIGLTRKF